MRKNASGNQHRGGLFILGSLYPAFTGGMEIFNFYFINFLIAKNDSSVYYLGHEKTGLKGGEFIRQKNRKPVRLFYPAQFFFHVFTNRKKISYAYLSYAEQSWIITLAHAITLRLFGIPYVVTIHWGKEPDWKIKFPFALFFRGARAVIGVSEPICIAFNKKLPGLQCQYIPPLIPFEKAAGGKQEARSRLGLEAGIQMILFVGSLKEMKNPDKIVEALHLLGKEFLEEHHIRMVFAGAGHMELPLKEKVASYDLGSYIRFDGLVGRENVPDYYRAADFYIIPSDYEGTSLSLLEAMFNGLAIVASDAPGINKMVSHEQNGLLFEINNIQQLANALRRLITDPLLAGNLSERAHRDYTLQYSYENMVKKYEDIFISV